MMDRRFTMVGHGRHCKNCGFHPNGKTTATRTGSLNSHLKKTGHEEAR